MHARGNTTKIQERGKEKDKCVCTAVVVVARMSICRISKISFYLYDPWMRIAEAVKGLGERKCQTEKYHELSGYFPKLPM